MTKCLTRGVSNQRAKLCPSRLPRELLQTHKIPAAGFYFFTNPRHFLYLFVTGKLFPVCRREGEQAMQREGSSSPSHLPAQQELKSQPGGGSFKREKEKKSSLACLLIFKQWKGEVR